MPLQMSLVDILVSRFPAIIVFAKFISMVNTTDYTRSVNKYRKMTLGWMCLMKGLSFLLMSMIDQNILLIPGITFGVQSIIYLFQLNILRMISLRQLNSNK